MCHADPASPVRPLPIDNDPSQPIAALQASAIDRPERCWICGLSNDDPDLSLTARARAGEVSILGLCLRGKHTWLPGSHLEQAAYPQAGRYLSHFDAHASMLSLPAHRQFCPLRIIRESNQVLVLLVQLASKPEQCRVQRIKEAHRESG